MERKSSMPTRCRMGSPPCPIWILKISSNVLAVTTYFLYFGCWFIGMKLSWSDYLPLQLQQLPVKDISSYHYLEKLHVDGNNLSTTQNFSFISFWKLKWLTMSRNVTRLVATHSFYGLSSLTCLRLEHNYIMEINLGDIPLGTMINLKYNPLRGLEHLQGLMTSTYDMHQMKYRKHWRYLRGMPISGNGCLKTVSNLLFNNTPFLTLHSKHLLCPPESASNFCSCE